MGGILDPRYHNSEITMDPWAIDLLVELQETMKQGAKLQQMLDPTKFKAFLERKFPDVRFGPIHMPRAFEALDLLKARGFPQRQRKKVLQNKCLNENVTLTETNNQKSYISLRSPEVTEFHNTFPNQQIPECFSKFLCKSNE